MLFIVGTRLKILLIHNKNRVKFETIENRVDHSAKDQPFFLLFVD